MSGAVLMAEGEFENIWGFWKNPESGAGAIILVLLALFVIGLVVFIWAAFWRKPQRRQHSHHHHASASNGSSEGLPRRKKRKSRTGILQILRRNRRHHRRRRRERPTNPTLDQVGGLPPSRREQPPVH